jgi:hypothetical protein
MVSGDYFAGILKGKATASIIKKENHEIRRVERGNLFNDEGRIAAGL